MSDLCVHPPPSVAPSAAPISSAPSADGTLVDIPSYASLRGRNGPARRRTLGATRRRLTANAPIPPPVLVESTRL